MAPVHLAEDAAVNVRTSSEPVIHGVYLAPKTVLIATVW
jgi:hypothetical protein